MKSRSRYESLFCRFLSVVNGVVLVITKVFKKEKLHICLLKPDLFGKVTA